MPGDYTRCPFSIGMFIGTAVLITHMHRKSSSTGKAGSTATKDNPSSDAVSNIKVDVPPCEVVFNVGGPGAGKGTNCQLLEERLDGWVHLSAGDLLRAERQAGGELGDMINAKIAAGELVPSSVTVKLLEKAMGKVYSESKKTKFLIDGFPRSIENLDAWEETMGKHTVKFVLEFECPEEVLVGRLLERGKSSGRTDDNIDVIRKRFQTHQRESAPVMESIKKKGITVHKIASDQSIEQVYSKTVVLF